MTTSEKLLEILRYTGLTQVQLARMLNVSHQTLSSWLHAQSVPRLRASTAIDQLVFELLGIGTVSDELLERTILDAKQANIDTTVLFQDTYVLKKLSVLMTYHTNSIEGSTMTKADNEKVLLEQKVLRNRTSAEQLEARNHQAALLWLLSEIESGNYHFCEQLTRELHVRLMNGLASDAGSYRAHGVRIMGSRVAVANYLRVPEKMTALFSQPAPGNFEELAKFHAAFEQIHPFSDGNGRVGRLLLTGLALQQGMMPPIIRRESRAAYYRYLEQAQMHNEYQPLTYLLARETYAAHQTVFAKNG